MQSIQRRLYQCLVSVAKKRFKFAVRVEEHLPHASMRYRERLIVLPLEYDTQRKLRALGHELGHVILNHIVDFRSDADIQIEAEAFSYYLLNAFGIEDEACLGYIRGWTAQPHTVQEVDIVMVADQAARFATSLPIRYLTN
jgi:hypothetical protein